MQTIPTELPKPSDEAVFERMCVHIYAVVFDDPLAAANGRRGQEQHGLDAIIHSKLHGVIGLQFKQRNSGQGFDKRLILNSVEEVDRGGRQINKLIIATTAPNDARLLRYVEELTEQRRTQERFPVYVEFWDAITRHIRADEELQNSYEPNAPGAILHRHQGEILHILRALQTRMAIHHERWGSRVARILQRAVATKRGGKRRVWPKRQNSVASQLGESFQRNRSRWLACISFASTGAVCAGLATHAHSLADAQLEQLRTVETTNMQSLRLEHAATRAIQGHADAFQEIRAGVAQFRGRAHPVHGTYTDAGMAEIDKTMRVIYESAAVLLDQKNLLTAAPARRQEIETRAFELEKESANLIAAMPAEERARADRGIRDLVLDMKDVSTSVRDTLPGGMSDEALFLLARRTSQYGQLLDGLTRGNRELGLQGTRDPTATYELGRVAGRYGELRRHVGAVMENALGAFAAVDAEQRISVETKKLQAVAQTTKDRLQQDSTHYRLAALRLASMAALLGLAAGAARVIRLSGL